jgi:hypothetical protein
MMEDAKKEIVQAKKELLAAKTKLQELNDKLMELSARGACSTSNLGLILAGAPAWTPWKGGLHKKPLDKNPMMREKVVPN